MHIHFHSAVCACKAHRHRHGGSFPCSGVLIVALLIRVGGLGVTSVGVGFILVAGKRVGFSAVCWRKPRIWKMERHRTACQIHSAHDTVLRRCGRAVELSAFVQIILSLEAALVAYFSFIAAFNNSGFDILGGCKI